MSISPPPVVCMAARAAADLRTAWRDAAGREPCGYLVGKRDASRVAVAFVVTGRNVHPQPGAAFRLDPDEHLAVRRRARAQGAELVGLWHGHLVGVAAPGRADAQGMGAGSPDLMVIAGREGGAPPRLRAYLRSGSAWRACSLEISAAAEAP